LEDIRLFIIALDGLSYDLVVKWNLSNLMQVTYGKVPVSPIYFGGNEVDTPSTPVIWSSFITGKNPREHGITGWWTYGKTWDWLRKNPPFVWVKNKRGLLKKIGVDSKNILKPKIVDKTDLQAKTIFDYVKPSIALDVPTYSDISESRLSIFDTLVHEGLEAYEKAIWKIHNERVNRLFIELHNPWNLYMVWFDVPDLLGHMHIAKRPHLLREVYIKLDNLVYTLKNKLPEEITYLIISDHGMMPESDGTGVHSLEAFWSLNIPTDFSPCDLTDFFPWMMQLWT
jgi:predicted AlkP superfamily pyrophosphatase or phosphodiesterase